MPGWKNWFNIGLLSLTTLSYAQSNIEKMLFPLPSFMGVAGSFCELRANHFHGGIDFKTNKKEGFPLKSVLSGKIRRIAVNSGGYGRVLYIDHPSQGVTSVYAHLSSFSPKIQALVDSVANATQSNTLDFQPAYDIMINRGEIIAFSGNSGSSSAPHLHFEVRDMITENILSPLDYLPSYPDNSHPKFINLKFINKLTNKTINSSPLNGKSTTLDISELTNFPYIDVAIEVVDQTSDLENKLGIQHLSMSVNGKTYSSQSWKNVSFSDQKLVNIHNHLFSNSQTYMMSYSACASNYSAQKDSGEMRNNLSDFWRNEPIEGIDSLVFKAIDFHQNVITHTVNFKPNKVVLFAQPKAQNNQGVFDCNYSHQFDIDQIQLNLPKNTIDRHFSMNYSIETELYKNKNMLYAIKLLDDFTPCLKTFDLAYKPSQSISESLKKSIYLKVLGLKNKNYIGTWRGEMLHFKDVYGFGTFQIKIDSNPPKCTKSNETKNLYYVTIDDKESGVQSIQVFCEGKWVHSYYDLKYKRLEILKTAAIIGKPLEIIVKDIVGNTTKFTYQ
ncbi:MAG: M23 family metallopeptidase [Chitinophagales bacterium]|jgi:hypothetical protein|nr:M23 family metallopeptidase [Chitinophagales bacterium]